MSDSIKNIPFQNRQDIRSFFDVVRLRDILGRQPSDHNQFENHRLTFFALMFITEGTGTHSINFIEYPFEPGTVFSIRPDSIHRFHTSDAQGYLLIFTEDFILQYLGDKNAHKIFQLFNELLASPKQQLKEGDIQQILTHIDAINTEYFRVKDDFSLEMIRGLLHIIITHLLRIKSMNNEIFGRTKYLGQFLEFQKLVEQHCEANRKVSFYAEKLNITPRTLNNITHSIVHKSAKLAIDDILLLKIKRLLINSQLNITQIAYEMGFYEGSHLFKFFKKYTGHSPKKFRELFK